MLTDTQIRALKSESGKTKRKKDHGGLVAEVRPSGKKVFLFRFQWEKKPQTMTLGTYPSLTLSDARASAVLYRDLLNRGIDPRKRHEPLQKNLLSKKSLNNGIKRMRICGNQ
jgi:hypothetical protein